MPTAGTHITVIERLALEEEFAKTLGDPNADADDDEALKMRFAKLGAIGPDLFYALADYGPELQDLVNFLSKLAGSVECILDIGKKIDAKVREVESGVTLGASDEFRRVLDEFTGLFNLVSSTITEGLIATVVSNGVNFWPVFEARRQLDMPRTTWFWADYLHYVRSGEFVRKLLNASAGNDYHRAYALGYLSHYVTDVVGHPYVNMVVGAPWRAYWQRHHLVENFIDAYVWDRWHEPRPAPAPPSTEEAPLDTVLPAPHATPGLGAPMTFARINDHINIGVDRGDDPVDRLISDICARIDQGLEDVGLAEPNPEPPATAEFTAWTEFVAEAFQSAYPPEAEPPENLKGGGRPDGYPTADDVAAAYSLLRLFLRVTTEQTVTEPEFPDVVKDVWEAAKQMLDKVATDLGSIPPFPSGGHGGAFSLESLWESICDWVVWAAKAAVALGKAAIDFIRGAIHVAGELLVDMIKMGLYLLKKALFDLYESFRHFLVRAAYALPRIDELVGDLGGGVDARTLWRTRNSENHFPMSELPDLEEARLGNHYAPWIPIANLAEMRGPGRPIYEMPWAWAGPYTSSGPDDFIDEQVGPRAMLARDGPVDLEADPGTFQAAQESFGGAIANCAEAFRSAMDALDAGEIPAGFFPDYNLDGDRGYGWPCWDVDKANDSARATLHPAHDGDWLTVGAHAIRE